MTAAHFKRKQKCPSVKKRLAREKKVSEGFAKMALVTNEFCRHTQSQRGESLRPRLTPITWSNVEISRDCYARPQRSDILKRFDPSPSPH